MKANWIPPIRMRLYSDAYRALSNKKLLRIDGSFHFIMLDQSVSFVDRLAQVRSAH
jgi:pimeloyl-ACP methyl ester carboxylesterase